MKPRYILRSLLLAAGGSMLLASAGLAQTLTCNISTNTNTIKLLGNCETAGSIDLSPGQTLDGAGYTITAIEDESTTPLRHFKGGVIRNTIVSGGTSFNVKNLTIVFQRNGSACGSAASDDRLVGILFDGASGSVKNTVVSNVNRGLPCGEGNGIEVRNFGTTTTKVTLSGNTVTGYGKTGIVANGNVDVTITNNLVDAQVASGVADSATVINGIQLGYGATGTVRANTVSGNRTTAPVPGGASSAGILAFGLDGLFCVGVTIQANTLVNNDVGVFLSQKTTGGDPPPTKTGIRVAGNTITNEFGNSNPYQAGISVAGNGDKLMNNDISGDGYQTGTYLLIDTDGGGVAVPFL